MTKKFKELRKDLFESNLSRIHQHTQERQIGIISAHRGELPKAENEANTHELKDKIRQHGYGHIVLKGVYPENKGTPQEKLVHEHSYLVVGPKHEDGGKFKKFLTDHGSHYNQDAILHKPHDSKTASLVGTGHSDWIKKGESVSAGEWHPNRVGEFHSKLHNNKTFQFSTESFEFPETYFGEFSKFLTK